jgi:hypothetical protein
MSLKLACPNSFIYAAVAALITSSALIGAAQALPSKQHSALQTTSIVVDVASKKMANDSFEANTEKKLNAAAKSLRGSKEFMKAVESKDSKAISAWVLKQSGLDVPLSVHFKGDVNTQDFTIFIGCQKINGQINCGIWLYD